MAITFEFCSNETDFQATYLLFVESLESVGLRTPPEKTLRDRYDNNELIIGKDGNKVISFYQFRMDENEEGLCRHIVVYVSPAYRGTGVSTNMLDFGKPFLIARGVTHLEGAVVSPTPNTTAMLVSRNMIYYEQRISNGSVYNIYRKWW